jgi:hypothetical protein
MITQMELGDVLADNGMERALLSKPLWSKSADTWFYFIPSGKIFTSEDLTDAVGLPAVSEANSNNAVGAKIRSWRGEISHAGYAKSTRTISHGRVISVWRKL